MPVFEAFFSRNRFQLQNLGLRKGGNYYMQGIITWLAIILGKNHPFNSIIVGRSAQPSAYIGINKYYWMQVKCSHKKIPANNLRGIAYLGALHFQLFNFIN
jgi:hypothetical protein